MPRRTIAAEVHYESLPKLDAITWILVFGGLLWGPPIHGNYPIAQASSAGHDPCLQNGCAF